MHKLSFLIVVVVFVPFVVSCSSMRSYHADTMPSPAPSAQTVEIKSTDTTEGMVPNVNTSPLLIYTSNITLEAKEDAVKELTGKIVDKTKGLGGYMSQRSSNALVLRVPAKEFSTLHDFVKSLGQVKYENVVAQDVTMQYTDLKIRLDVQTKMLTRYQDLLKKASDVKEAVEVERELSRITERLEQLKGQIRYYDSQINYSTVNVSFQEPYTTLAKDTKPGPLGWVFYGLYVGIKWLFIWD